MFFLDARVIAQHEGLQVLAQQQEIPFKDRTRLTFHAVAVAGTLQTFLRAISIDGLQWLVFDLRHLSPTIETDVLALDTRDTPGVVLYTLRGQYTGAADFTARAVTQCVTTWWQQHDAPHVALLAA